MGQLKKAGALSRRIEVIGRSSVREDQWSCCAWSDEHWGLTWFFRVKSSIDFVCDFSLK